MSDIMYGASARIRRRPAPRRTLLLTVLLCVTLVLVSGAVEAQIVPSQLAHKAMIQGSVPVIVRLEVGVIPEGLLGGEAVQRQRQRIATAQRNVLAALAGREHRVRHQYQTVPFLAVEAGPAALAALELLKGIVARVDEDALASPTLAESVPLVQATTAWSSGYTGSGKVIAVLDTGVDKAHAFLTGKVVEEACYSGNGNCPNGLTSQTGSGAGIPCTYAGACFHGTHVAGIAAGLGSAAAPFAAGGVAKGANLMAVQVFSRFTGAGSCGSGPDPCARSYTSDQLAGLERVYALRDAHAFASVNMSLGGGRAFSNCDSHPLKVAIDNLRSVGVATVISSGNDGFTDSTGSPACISTAVSVGSTDDGSAGTVADAISGFSNSASFLSLLAPGRSIISSIPGGSSGAASGTSMSAPHVAGAWAILTEASASSSVSEILTVLQGTGLPLTDPRNGITKSRIRILQALQALSSSDEILPTVTITTPTSDPAHSIESTPMALAGSASDDVGVTGVDCSNAANGITVAASGTTAWSCTVALVSGINVITVRAFDAAINIGTDLLTVSYTPQNANDACSTATLVSAVPYTKTQSTTAATAEAGEPSPGCGNGSKANSVWYRFTPSVSGSLTVDTSGSNYDTILSTYVGSCGDPIPVPGGCDAGTKGVQSRVELAVSAGTTYHFMVSSSAGGNPGGGNLVFNLTESSALSGADFHTVAPCRVADTRGPAGPWGGPALSAAAFRTFPVAGLCGIPASAKAIAANVTVVNPDDSGHLTLFPAGAPPPLASTINFRPGLVRANSAIVPFGASGGITVWCVMGAGGGSTHFVLDVSGYFE